MGFGKARLNFDFPVLAQVWRVGVRITINDFCRPKEMPVLVSSLGEKKRFAELVASCLMAGLPLKKFAKVLF